MTSAFNILLTARKILIFLLLCSFNGAFAQLSFDHLSVSNGLSQSTVQSICKDSRGYMWFGTRDCLNRYDGKTIKIYRTSSDNLSSISSDDYIFALKEDHEKNLWIGTQNGLNRYIPEKDAFERIIYIEKDKNSISDKSINCISEDRKGRLWFATGNGLSMLINPSSRKFTNFYQKDGLAGNAIYAVFEDSKGILWVGTTNGLSMMKSEKGGFKITSFNHHPEDQESLSDNFVRTIVEDRKGRIWIGTEKGGLNLFVPQSASFVRFKYDALNPKGLSNNSIRKMMLDNNGNVWVGTMNGLNILNVETLNFSVYKHEPDNRKSLSDNSIKEIYKDEQGSIWLGTMFGGVNVNHHNSITFDVYKYNKYRNSISGDIISAIEADDQGNLWVGTEGQGLNCYNVKTGLFKHYVNDPFDPGSLSHNTIKAIFKDGQGRMWVGLYEGGLELFVPATGKFKHYPPDPKNPNALSYGYIPSIAEGDQGRLLIGTSSQGLDIFDPQKQIFTHITESPGKGLTISGNYITFVYQDSKRNIWVGTLSGLSLLSPGAKQFKIFRKNDKNKGSLQSNLILCIRESSNGKIWIGSMRGGLSLYHPKTRAFTTYNKQNGLPSNKITNLLEDNEGNLWISSDRGLTKFDPRRGSFKNYNTSDGLPSNEFNVNSAYKDKNGKLYFGSFNGLVAFTPRDIKENTVVAKTVFSGLKLFNKPVRIGGRDQLLNEDISFTKSITFSADQNIFTIDFVTLNYIQPQRNKYAYKLENFEKDWNYVNIPTATYTNLPSGKYRLLVKGSNNDGLWNKNPTALEIRILPPLWRTWWAYLLYFTIAVISLYFVLRFTRRQQRLKSKLYYEQLHSEQQQELFQMKLDFFTRISHEIRTPLTLIFAPLEKLIKLTQENSTVNHSLIGIRRNTDRLLRLISELLDFRKIESGHVNLHVSKNDLVAFSHNIYRSYLSLAELKNIDYQFTCKQEEVLIYFDAGQMEKVFYNILSNSFKYTPDGGKIIFAIAEHDGQAEVTITDNGIGIPLDVQDKVFTNFYQVKSRGVAAEGWGIGLALVKDIVELHKGQISVSSEPALEGKNGKTCLTILLRFGKEHFSAEELSVGDSALKILENVPEQQAGRLSSEGVEAIIEKKYTVLVVEDNDELRGFIVQSLKATYHILESIDGLKGWESAIENVPDIILSDVTMPELNGLELCIRLKQEERTSHIPVIMLTAMASQLHQVNGLEAGADVYITKPFSIQVLELSIRNLLHGREELKQKYAKQIMLTPRKLDIASPDEKFLNKLMQVVEDGMEDPEFNVTGLVDRIGMSQTVLYRKIKSLTDLSITDFIKSQRLKRAEQLLAENKLNISDVAYAVGFNDRKYFSKEFRKQFGYAPSKYNEKTD